MPRISARLATALQVRVTSQCPRAQSAPAAQPSSQGWAGLCCLKEAGDDGLGVQTPESESAEEQTTNTHQEQAQLPVSLDNSNADVGFPSLILPTTLCSPAWLPPWSREPFFSLKKGDVSR